MAFRLVVLLGILGIAGSDPSILVRRLGASKYSEREEASLEIEKLGRDALPALKVAKTATDAEIRSRASDLVERIESDLMVKPTLVTLDFQNATLGSVFAKISEVGHANFLVPAGLKSRVVDLNRDEPVPFWQAVDLISQVGGVELAAGLGGYSFDGGSRHSTFNLIPTLRDEKLAPISSHGPFRISLISLNRHKERDFMGNGGNPVPMGGGNGMNPAGQAAGVENFTAQLLVMAEPRMSVAANGPPRLIEACDELGNSLLPSSTNLTSTFFHHAGYNGFDAQSGNSFPQTLSLRYPAIAGKSIRRLKGMIPVTVASRKEEPLVISLVDAKGKTFQNSEVSLTIHEVKVDPRTRQTLIDLTVQSRQPVDPNLGFTPNFMVRGAGSSQGPLEFVDTHGKVIPQWYPSGQQQGLEAPRLTIHVTTGLLSGPVAQLRYYETSRANIDADFEFLDVEMP